MNICIITFICSLNYILNEKHNKRKYILFTFILRKKTARFMLNPAVFY